MAVPKQGLTFHEAMIVVMVGKREFTMRSKELAAGNEARDLYRKEDGGYPDAAQVFLRASEYPQFFEVEGNAKAARVRLRRFGDVE